MSEASYVECCHIGCRWTCVKPLWHAGPHAYELRDAPASEPEPVRPSLRDALSDVQTLCRQWLGRTSSPIAQTALLKIHERACVALLSDSPRDPAR